MSHSPASLANLDLVTLAERLGRQCRRHGATLTAAESCTGGGVASAITAVAGSSDYFETGYVTYSNAAKTRLLGVPEALLEAHGAVSAEVVEAMVVGACRDSGAAL
ncbi:MAG: CinA family protein, partial [Halomonas sp.]